MGSALEDVYKLLPSPDHYLQPFKFSDYEETKAGIYAKIDGVRKQVVAFSGELDSVGKFLGGASLKTVFASMGSLTGALEHVAAFAGPLSGIVGVGTGIVNAFAGLFGGPPPDPPPSVEGLRVQDIVLAAQGDSEEDWSDRIAEAVGKIVNNPRHVHSKNKVDLGSISDVLTREVKVKLEDAILENRGKRIDPSQYRKLSICLAQIDPKTLTDWIGVRHARNLASLLAYGAPRAILRRGLSAYGLATLAETSSWYGGGRVGSRANSRCSAMFRGRYTSEFSKMEVIAETTELGTFRKAEKDLCQNTPETYRNLVAARLLPDMDLTSETGRIEITEQVPQDVVDAELDHFRNEPPEIYVYVDGIREFKFRFDGDSPSHGIRWPAPERAVVGALRMAASRTDWVERVKRQIAEIRSATGKNAFQQYLSGVQKRTAALRDKKRRSYRQSSSAGIGAGGGLVLAAGGLLLLKFLR